MMLYKWFIISVILQVLAMIFINVYILNANSKITTSAPYEIEEMVNQKQSNGIQIPSEAVSVKFSYNLNYLAFMSGGSLIIQETSKLQNKKAIAPEEAVITHFRWMEDRNMLIYAKSISLNNSTDIEIHTIDFEINQENTYPKIKGLSRGAQVRWIEVSYLTKMLYAQVLTASNERIYAYDIMGNLSFVSSFPKGTIIRETRYFDSLFIDENKGAIKFYDGITKTQIPLKLEGEYVLLNVDKDDHVFVGKLDQDGKIERIQKGVAERRGVKEWADIVLDEPVSLELIVVDLYGRLFINNLNESLLVGIGNNVSLKYKGQLLDIRKDLVVMRDHDILTTKKLEE
jgi:hypothetical protein